MRLASRAVPLAVLLRAAPGGSLSVESPRGDGTTIRVVFPREALIAIGAGLGLMLGGAFDVNRKRSI